ncbi:MAG: hypothetical protein U0736_22880 [Gemmataceae bacterium]
MPAPREHGPADLPDLPAAERLVAADQVADLDRKHRDVARGRTPRKLVQEGCSPGFQNALMGRTAGPVLGQYRVLDHGRGGSGRVASARHTTMA